MQNPIKTILGCMSGTSLDGIDLAVLTTNGDQQIDSGKNFYMPYTEEERDLISRAFMKRERDDTVIKAESVVTDAHIKAIKKFIEREQINFDLIGFHGQTITHDPVKHFTWQIGDAAALHQAFQKPVVYNFRADDVKVGGQGAPLLPIYHRALLQKACVTLPACILNIGGVSNITYISDDTLIAFDCGAGNALLDTVMKTYFQKPYDDNGAHAKTGIINRSCLDTLFADEFFQKPAPKSLDRNPWNLSCLTSLAPEDQLATLLQFTVQAIHKAIALLPHTPTEIFVAGGGRHNNYMMECLKNTLNIEIKSIDTLGFNGDFIEAEGFAYMAARRLYNLPITFPQTTGAPRPMTGGTIIGL